MSVGLREGAVERLVVLSPKHTHKHTHPDRVMIRHPTRKSRYLERRQLSRVQECTDAALVACTPPSCAHTPSSSHQHHSQLLLPLISLLLLASDTIIIIIIIQALSQQSVCASSPPLLPRCEAMMGDTRALKPRLAKLFWACSRREAYASLYHPFVVSLAAGTLPDHAFQRYMAQDAYFLEAFRNAYQMARESTEDEEAKATIDSLRRDVQEELALHSSVMQSMNGDFEPNTATTAYCEFLRASGSDHHTAAKIIAAMTPCMRLYAFLGQEIKKNINPVADHPYQQWIDTYSSADFEAAASRVEQLLDKLTETVSSDEDKALLYSLYKRAMALEVDFFGAQQPGPVAKIPFFKPEEQRLLLVSDFDSTCTISDSCPVLADLTVQVAGKVPGGRSAGETGAGLLRNKWDELVMRYMDEYEEVLNRSLSNKGSGKAFTAEELQEFLKEMSDFEKEANARVEKADVLKGLSPGAIQDAGKSMPLREGCTEFFKRLAFHEGHVDTHILSVCWSKLFIEAVLEQGDIHIANITANELVFDGGASTGKIAFQVQTALDKLKHFNLELLRGQSKERVQQLQSVYIGDSLTDLLCLLRADVGIVLGDSATLKQVYGDKTASLFRKAVGGAGAGHRELEGCVFSVANWYEVEAFLLGSRVL